MAGILLGISILLIGGFAAIAAVQAINEGDRENLSTRVYRSITRTTWWLGLPAVLVLIVLARMSATPGSSGIMSLEMGLCIFAVVAVLGMLVLWLGCIAMGALGTLVARSLPAGAAGAVVFAFTGGGAVLAFIAFAIDLALKRDARGR